MSVQYFNGKFYDIPESNFGVPNLAWQQQVMTNSPAAPKPIIPPSTSGANGYNGANGMNGYGIFSSASSGGVSGTLQPYVNRMTQNANNALYGGLLGYQPSQLVAGNAGGTPISPTPPQWRLPSAIPTPNQGQVGLIGPQANPQQQMGIFGNRSWMGA